MLFFKLVDLAVELAQLPDLIRGYDEVKVANVAKFRQAAAKLNPEPNYG